MYVSFSCLRANVVADLGYSTDEFISKHPHSEYANTNLPERSLSFPQLADYIKKYQDPSQADSIMKIQQELDQTKIVLYVTLRRWTWHWLNIGIQAQNNRVCFGARYVYYDKGVG
jgi:hypothetical protein